MSRRPLVPIYLSVKRAGIHVKYSVITGVMAGKRGLIMGVANER